MTENDVDISVKAKRRPLFILDRRVNFDGDWDRPGVPGK